MVKVGFDDFDQKETINIWNNEYVVLAAAPIFRKLDSLPPPRLLPIGSLLGERRRWRGKDLGEGADGELFKCSQIIFVLFGQKII